MFSAFRALGSQIESSVYQNSAGRYPLISRPMQISMSVGVVQAIRRQSTPRSRFFVTIDSVKKLIMRAIEEYRIARDARNADNNDHLK